ncbi:MAG: SLBB domain-containing protein [Candidatus Margulisiibacteriota bacterium]|nr:SLBB domain-containing protein [Candidatus Margulisiibacteriota bacterium]
MRLLAGFLILSLLLPLAPTGALAQISINTGSFSLAGNRTPVSGEALGISSKAGAAKTAYVPQGNISEDYLLGPGDDLDVHLMVGNNALDLDYDFVINPEGKIFFPKIGEVHLSGLTLKQAKVKLIKKIKTKFYQKFSLSIMVSEPKNVKIYVTGLVQQPGLHKVYDGSRISEVIRMVGVIPGGSHRKVVIKRNDYERTVDLYEVLYRGNEKADIPIQLGDVIDVPPAGSARVTIMGEVPRPGQYELKDGEKLTDALALAGYVGVNSALSEVAYLKRKKGEDSFENNKLNLYNLFLNDDDSQDVVLEDGDIISIPAIKHYVYVYGEIKEGGRISYIPGQKLSDYINISGGPTVKANLSGVTVTRQDTKRPKVFHINASNILHRGIMDKDIEILAGDVINVPGNFFYFSDFSSLANTMLLGLSLYTAFIK